MVYKYFNFLEFLWSKLRFEHFLQNAAAIGALIRSFNEPFITSVLYIPHTYHFCHSANLFKKITNYIINLLADRLSFLWLRGLKVRAFYLVMLT